MTDLDSAAGAGGAGATDPSLVDAATFRELLELGGQPLIEEMVDLYEQSSAAHARDLRRALEGGDGGQASREAHALKGSSLNIGARRVADLATRIEERVRAGSFDGLGDLAGDLERERLRSVAALRAVAAAAG